MGNWLETAPRNLIAFQYIGSKYKLAQLIVQYLEATPHSRYVEVFGGTACVLLMKPPPPPSSMEVYNDKDYRLASLFKVLSTPALFKRFWQLFAVSVHCREYRHKARLALRSRKNVVRTAWAAAVCLSQGFSGIPFNGWSYSSCTRTPRRVVAALYNLPVMHERLKRVHVEQMDFTEVIDKHDSERTLFYCDPPYVLSTVQTAPYALCMTDDEHRTLVEKLLKIRGAAIVSGYDHEIYAPLVQNGWRRLDIPVRSLTARKPRRRPDRIESLWLSPGVKEPNCGPLLL